MSSLTCEQAHRTFNMAAPRFVERSGPSRLRRPYFANIGEPLTTVRSRPSTLSLPLQKQFFGITVLTLLCTCCGTKAATTPPPDAITTTPALNATTSVSDARPAFNSTVSAFDATSSNKPTNATTEAISPGVAVISTTTPTISTTDRVISPKPAGLPNGEGVCRRRYLTPDDNDTGLDKVGMAAILDLRWADGTGCGRVSSVDLQVAAALVWGVRMLNGDLQIPLVGPYIPGLHLDLRIYDDCAQGIMVGHHIGEALNVHPDFNCTPANPPLAGVLGTSLSRTTTRLASLLADTNVPNFGISATLLALSDSEIYPTFFRTVPTDLMQSKVLVELTQRLGWSYVAGLYTRDNYGVQGFKEFKRLATEAGICVFKEASFLFSDDKLEDNLEAFVRQLLIDLSSTRYDSLGVVMFTQLDVVLAMFQMIEDRRSKWHNQEKLENLFWLSSDGVGTSSQIAVKLKQYQRSKLFSISAATVPMPDFRDFFFDLLDNPQQLGPYWESLVHEYLIEELGCTLPSPTIACNLRNRVQQYDYVPAALDSLYSLAALLKTAHAKTCGSGGEDGVCEQLAQTLKAGLLSAVQPQPLNFSLMFEESRLPEAFRADRTLIQDEYGDFVTANNPLYFINVASRGQWKKIGEYSNGSITFESETELASVPRSECGRQCSVCLTRDRIYYRYQPGDLIILGLYSLRKAEVSDSFECSISYRNQGSTIAAFIAFLRTVEKIAKNSGSGSGVTYPKLGALALDDCYNRLTASSLLVDLFNGLLNITDTDGQLIDMSKVVAVVGSQSSSVTLSALSILTPLNLPTVSYSATSPDLDDRENYPYFLRTVPSDSLQARALVDLLHAINVTHVGALRQNNNYGLRGMQAFVEMAETEGICVETPAALDDKTTQPEILRMLNSVKSSRAAVVVVFLTEPTVIQLLDTAKNEEQLGLVFVASEAWGLGTKTLLHNRPFASRGSLVLTVDSTRQASSVSVDMKTYLSSLTLPFVTLQPEWLRDFWGKQFECNLPGGFDNSYDHLCSPDDRLSADVVNQLANDQKVVQTVNSVLSIATALKTTCGSNSNCQLTSNPIAFIDAIKNVQLIDEEGKTFRPFLDSGNGNVGFKVHNVQKDSSGSSYQYVQVGKYDSANGLQVDRGIVFYDLVGQPRSTIKSVCEPNSRQCAMICGAGLPTTTASHVNSTKIPDDDIGKEGLVAAVAFLAVVCFLLLALVVVVVVCACRRHLPLKGLFKASNRHVDRTTSTVTNSSTVNYSPTGRGDNPPLSFRADLPLPPIPRGSVSSAHQYNEMSDNTSRSSRSYVAQRQTSVVSEPAPQTAFAEGVDALNLQPLGVDNSNYDHAEHSLQMLPQDPQGSRQCLNQQRQHEDLLRQLQERRRMQELRRPPDDQSPLSAQEIQPQERPRASSASYAERPKFLPLLKGGGGGGRRNASESGSSQSVASAPVATRPRSLSQDAAVGITMGPVSEMDQQLLFRYLASMQAQRQNAAVASRAPQAQTPTRDGQNWPMSAAGQITSVPRLVTPAGTPTIPFAVRPFGVEGPRMASNPTPPVAGQITNAVRQVTPAGTPTFPNAARVPGAESPRMAANQVFVNPAHPGPTGDSPGAAAPVQNYGSLMYLHPVGTDNEHMYLQAHPSSGTLPSFAFPPGTIVVVPAGMYPTSPPAVAQAAPGGPGYPCTPTTGQRKKPKSTSATSPVSSTSSPLTSAPSSTTSTDSRPVFLPQSEFHPDLVYQPVVGDLAMDGHIQADFVSGVASYSPAKGPGGQVPTKVAAETARSPKQSQASPGQERTLSPYALEQLIHRHKISDRASGRGSSGLPMAGTSTSPPSSAGMDARGVVFLPQNIVPLYQDSYGPQVDVVPHGLQMENMPHGLQMDGVPHGLQMENVLRGLQMDGVPSTAGDPAMAQSLNTGQQFDQQNVLNDLSGRGNSFRPRDIHTGVWQRPKTRRATEGSTHGLRQDAYPLTMPNTGAQAGLAPSYPTAQMTPSAKSRSSARAQTPPQTPPQLTLQTNAALPRAESVPYIQGYQLIPVPPPCGPSTQHDLDLGSGDSNQTSGDSGNGEDLANTSDLNIVAVGV